VARLAITLELRIEELVARAIGIAAIGPFRIRALDREPAGELAERVADRQRVGHVVARRAHLGAHEHRLVVALVLGRIDLLVRDALAEYRAGVGVGRVGDWVAAIGPKRSGNTIACGDSRNAPAPML